jgi:hypothetical protein
VRGQGRVLGACALAVALASAVAPAEAQNDADPGDPAPRAQGFVDVAVAASPEEARAILDTLRELVARLGLSLRSATGDAPPWERLDAPPDAPGERARVWIDAHGADAVRIEVCVLQQGQPSPVLHRAVRREGSSAIVVDSVGHVVQATLESALLSPLPPPVAAWQPPLLPPLPPVAVPPTDARAPRPPHGSLTLDAAAFADGMVVAPHSGVALGGGGAFIVSAGPIPWRPSLFLGGSFQAPFDAAGPSETLEISVSSFRAVPSVELLRLRPVQVDLGAGGGADLFHAVPRNPRGPFPMPPHAETHVTPIVASQLLARIRLGPGARLLLGFDLDWDPGHRHYDVVDRFGNPNAVLQPWSVRPTALVGICVPLVGASACSGP